MTEGEKQKLDDIHEFLFGKTPGLAKAQSRAERIEDILRGYDRGKFAVRGSLWLIAFISAAGGAYGVIKGWWGK